MLSPFRAITRILHGDDNFSCGPLLMIAVSLTMVVILWFYINLGIFTIIVLEVLLLDYLMAWNLWHTCKRNTLPLIVKECSCSLLFITIEGVIEQWPVAPNADYFKLKPLWLILEVFFQQMLKFIPGCFWASYALSWNLWTLIARLPTKPYDSLSPRM